MLHPGQQRVRSATGGQLPARQVQIAASGKTVFSFPMLSVSKAQPEEIVAKRAASSRLVAALVLALVLVTQSVVGAFALGAAGAGPQFDAFGNPLCLNGPDHGGSSDSEIPSHSKIPSCCTFACSMFWPGIATPADIGRVAPGLRASMRMSFAGSKAIDLHAQGYRPGNPRAPPLTV